MAERSGRVSKKRGWARLAASACAAAALLVSVPAAAGAAAPAPTGILGPSMSLGFVRTDAHLVGPDALVLVRCDGPRAGLCTGTLRLALGGGHEVPFSVGGGGRETVAVPLESATGVSARRGARRVLAVASTVQPLGPSERTEKILRLK